MPVTEVQITRREHYAEGRTFGEAGAYDRIDGVLTCAVDPKHPANQAIVDLELAPRDSDGRVGFLTDFALLVPQLPEDGNGRLIVDVVNRGRKRAVSTFNRADTAEASSRVLVQGECAGNWIH